MSNYHLRLTLLLSLLSTSAASAVAQSVFPITLTTPDGVISIPSSTGVLGKWDTSAMAEITSHLNVLGAGKWTGMQATGQITYGTLDKTPYAVTLSNVGIARYRMDEQTAKGPVSIRIHQPSGKIQGADGSLQPLPTTEIFAGLFPFALPRLLPLSGSGMSLRDQGIVTFGPQQLHRLTLERPTLGTVPGDKTLLTSAIDLYFDPITHLLVKSATLVGTTGSRGQTLLSVISYSDYRLVGLTMVPFHYVQTLEGEQAVSLQLSTVQLNPKLDDTNFQF